MVEASRAFVCIRPNTYESAEEGKLLEGFFRGRSGQLENTVFVLLDSDGKSRLSRAGRVPQAVFGSAERFAAELTAIAAERAATGERPLAIPLQPDLRHGLNVAACDSVALLVLHGDDAAAVDELRERLAPVLWRAGLPARVRCVAVVVGKDAADVERVPLAAGTGVSLVAPERFGRTGSVLVHVDGTAAEAEIVAALDEALRGYRPPARRATPEHIREGRREGVHWETVIPVTDPGPEGRRPPDGPEAGDGPPRRGPRGRRRPPPPPDGGDR